MAAYPDIEDPQYTDSGVPYEFIFENYTEQFTNRGTNSTIKARCAWVDAGDFLWDILGYTVSATSIGMAGGSVFNRYLPLSHPEISSLFCTDATLLSYPSSSKAGANQANVIGGALFESDWAIYRLTFTRLPYFVVNNADIASPPIASMPPETQRYLVPVFRPRAREFTVNSYALKPEGEADTKAIKTPAFIMDREQDLFTTLLEIPADKMPWTAIDDCLGKINNADITLPTSIDPSGIYSYRTFARDTLLFRGLANELSQYQGASGYWYYDAPYFMTYRPNGWRKLPNPTGDGSYVTMVRIGIIPTKYMYDEADFSLLYKPEQ